MNDLIIHLQIKCYRYYFIHAKDRLALEIFTELTYCMGNAVNIMKLTVTLKKITFIKVESNIQISYFIFYKNLEKMLRRCYFIEEACY